MKKIILLFLLFFQFSFAQDGTYDISFGTSGIVDFSVQEMETRVFSVLALEDGSILTAGNTHVSQFGGMLDCSFFVSKFLPNGAFDPSFGLAGTVFFPGTATYRFPFFSMKVQNDGKIILLCWRNDGEVKLIRLNTNGSFDSSFGNQGTVDLNNIYVGLDFGLQSNGKIIVAGQYYNGQTNNSRYTRYNVDGSIDTTFGFNGSFTADLTPYSHEYCNSMIIQPDDKILAVGSSSDVFTEKFATIARFGSNGFLDLSFGNNGVLITPIGPSPGWGEFMEVDLQQNGKIVVCGNQYYANGTGGFGGSKPMVVRYYSNGLLDNSFGTGGKKILNTVFNANDRVNSLKVQPDNKIIIGGGSSYPYPYMQTFFYLTRLNTDGSKDLNFGANGNILEGFSGATPNMVYDIALQGDGKILATGYSESDDMEHHEKAVLCRFSNPSLVASSFEKKQNISIYPNPTNGILFIEGIEISAKMEIRDLNGKSIQAFQKKGNFAKTKLDLSKLLPGIYFLTIEQKSLTTTQKIMVK